MESLSKDLYSLVSKAIGEFADRVASKYDLKKDDLLELWNSNVSSELQAKAGKEDKKAATKKGKAAAAPSDAATCAYQFKKGANSGTKCNSKVRSDDSQYCNKHKSQEDKEQSPAKETKKAPAKKKEKEKEAPVVKKMNEGKPRMSITKNKFGNYEHAETKLILTKETKEVVGRQGDDGKVIPLTTEDIENCKKYGFKYKMPASLSSKVEKDQDDEDDDGGKDEDLDEDEDEEEEEEDDDE